MCIFCSLSLCFCLSFKVFFEESDQVLYGGQLLASMKSALEELCSYCEDEAERTPQTITTFEEAFEMITEKV